ncbi:hypothetical protein ACF3M1_13825 [Luteimonas sp. WGS1318]|uniref:hypothetical protein n=1 Tax=Luteimonas sp. WGS1318 TaxID=3366815 RepID=UPI00372D5FBD
MFAQWQSGDIETGDAALARAMAGFIELAPKAAFAEWPRRFWGLLLAVPGLRAPHALGTGGDGLPALAALAGGPRVTVLLRLVAGLAEHEAAAVLGVSRATYRLGLQRALPHLADGAPDAEAWRALSASIQAEIRALPPDRLARLAGLREAALRGEILPLRRFPLAAPVIAEARAATAPRRHAPWMWPAAAAVLVATLAALAWTWVGGGYGGVDDDEHIRIEALPDAEAPAARYDDALGLLTEPDFELLVAPEDGAAWRADPAFYAWLAAQLELPQDNTEDVHLETRSDAPDDAPETSDADL